MSEEKIKMDAQHTSSGPYKIWSSSLGSSTVRIEKFGFNNEFIKINEHDRHAGQKMEYDTLLAFRDVLNRWYEDEIVNRGKA